MRQERCRECPLTLGWAYSVNLREGRRSPTRPLLATQRCSSCFANQVDSGDPYVEERGSCPPLAPPAGGPVAVAAGGPWWPGLQPASASHSCHAQQPDSEAAPPAKGTFQDSLESLGAPCSLFLARAWLQTRTLSCCPPASHSPK